MKQAQTTGSTTAAETPVKTEPKVTILPYMGEDQYEGGRLTVSIPSGVLSSRDGTGLNGQGFSYQ